MEMVVLIIHLLVCVCLIGLVLLQRSEGGALGMGGGGGGAIMSGRGAADALARMTSVAGGFFLVTSLSLTLLSGAGSVDQGRSVLDLLPGASQPATPPAPAPAPEPETRPDPTESSAPEAAQSQLAAFGPSNAAAAEPTPAPAATRAGPIESRPTTTAAAQQTPRTTQVASTRPQQRSGSATTQPSRTTERSLTLPTTSGGAVSGIDLSEQDQLAPESVEVGNGLEAVRRERAGPDQ